MRLRIRKKKEAAVKKILLISARKNAQTLDVHPNLFAVIFKTLHKQQGLTYRLQISRWKSGACGTIPYTDPYQPKQPHLTMRELLK